MTEREERQKGHVYISGESGECFDPKCKERTKTHIWDGGVFQPVCDAHRHAFNDYLRANQTPQDPLAP